MSLFGFSSSSIEDIKGYFSKYECILLDFSSNPFVVYGNVKDKSSKVFICDLITAKYLTHKLGRVLDGFFVIKDSFFVLKINEIKCLDVSSSGLTIIDYYNLSDLNGIVKSKTKFPKSFLKDYSTKSYDLRVSSLLSKKKEELSSIQDLSEKFKSIYTKKDYKEVLCKAITNNIDYKSLDTKKHKFSSTLKKYMAQHKMCMKAVIAFQDIVYNLTDIDVAVNGVAAHKEDVLELLSMWNPNPTSPKSVTFPFNKKPLPKAKQTPKRLEKWRKQKHDIPKAILKKRKEVVNKNKRKHLSESELNYVFVNNGVMSINSFVKTAVEKAGLKYNKDYYILGSTLGDNVKLRKDNIISVLKKNSNNIIYVKVI